MSGQRFYGPMSANGQHSEKSAPRSSQRDRQPKVLITGGAGFIGSNVAASLMASGQRVIVYDSLARPGVEENLHWLQSNYSDQLEVELHDVRDAAELTRCIQHVEAVDQGAPFRMGIAGLDGPFGLCNMHPHLLLEGVFWKCVFYRRRLSKKTEFVPSRAAAPRGGAVPCDGFDPGRHNR